MIEVNPDQYFSKNHGIPNITSIFLKLNNCFNQYKVFERVDSEFNNFKSIRI